MAQQTQVSVQIYNQTYRLASGEKDDEYIRRAAAYLDQKMRATAPGMGQRAPLDIAVVAALEIAEEVLAARKHKDSFLNKTDQRLEGFTNRLKDQDFTG